MVNCHFSNNVWFFSPYYIQTNVSFLAKVMCPFHCFTLGNCDLILSHYC